VVSDHAALLWLIFITDPTGRLARWSLYLQSYEFEIVHRKGLKHNNFDLLSRPVLLVQTRSATKKAIQEVQEDTSTKNLDPYEDDYCTT